MPDWSVFFGCLFILWGFVFFQGALAWMKGFLTRYQMYQRHEIVDGDSFMEHGGMWADVFVISTIISYIVAVPHELDVHSRKSLVVLVIASIFWLAALWYFATLSKFRPEAHAYKGRITAAGYVHLLFAVVGTWVIALFYLSHPPLTQLIVISCLLTPFFHLGVRKFNDEWQWNPVAVVMTVGGPVAVWAFTLWRYIES